MAGNFGLRFERFLCESQSMKLAKPEKYQTDETKEWSRGSRERLERVRNRFEVLNEINKSISVMNQILHGVASVLWPIYGV